jgi:hypothetical protein
MSSKSKSTKNETTHQVVTPTNPDWITNPVQSLTQRIGGLSNLDPESLVAGADPLQMQAARGAASLGLAPAYAQASDLFHDAGGWGALTYVPTQGRSSSLLDGFSHYMSPYLDDVVNTSLADYDAGAGQTRAQNLLALAGDTTFGGSAGGIQTALSEDAINRGRGALVSQLLNQGYQNAAQLANEDAQRRQEMALANLAAQNGASQFNAQEYEAMLQRKIAAGSALANAATQQGADQRADIASQAAMGDALRQVRQQQLQAPISLLTTQTGLLNGLPLSLFHGEIQDGTGSSTSTKSSTDPLGMLGGVLTLPINGTTIGATKWLK